MVEENSTPLSKEYHEALLKSTKDICDMKIQEKEKILLEKDEKIKKNEEMLNEKDQIIQALILKVDHQEKHNQETEKKHAHIEKEYDNVKQSEQARREADMKLATCTSCNHYYSDPVTANCGHSFCRGCVQERDDKFKDCPECRETINSVCPSILLNSIVDRYHMEDVADLVARCSSRAPNGMRGGVHELLSEELSDEVLSMLDRLRGDSRLELLTHALTYQSCNPVKYRRTSKDIHTFASLEHTYYASNGDSDKLNLLSRGDLTYFGDAMRYGPGLKRNLTMLDKNNRGGMSYLLRNIEYDEYSIYGECLSCVPDIAPSDDDFEESQKQCFNLTPAPPQTDTASDDTSIEDVVGKCSTCSQTLPGLPADRKISGNALGAFRWLDWFVDTKSGFADSLENFFFGLTNVEQDTTKDLLANWAVYRLLRNNVINMTEQLPWSGQYRPIQVSC